MTSHRIIGLASVLMLVTAYILCEPHWENFKFSYVTSNSNLPCGRVSVPCKIGERSYNVASPRGKGPFPAVLYLHGSNGSGAEVIQDFNITRSFVENGYVVIAPTALDVDYRGGRVGSGWVWDSHRDGRDDYAFMRDVINDALSQFPVQSEDLIIAGHSRGATFTWYLACAGIDERVRHFAPISGTPQRGRLLSCAHAQTNFNLLHTHGIFDKVIPMIPSRSSVWLGVYEAANMIASAQTCELNASDADVQDSRTIRQYVCQSGTELRLDPYMGGHNVPQDWVDTVVQWHQSN